jgi:hypothetical protein
MLRSALPYITLAALGLALGFVSIRVMVTGLGYAGYGAYSIAFTLAGYGAFLDLGFGWVGVRFAAGPWPVIPGSPPLPCASSSGRRLRSTARGDWLARDSARAPSRSGPSRS